MKVFIVEIKDKVIWLFDPGLDVGAPAVIRIRLRPAAEVEIESCGRSIRLSLELTGNAVKYPTEAAVVGHDSLLGRCVSDGDGVTCMLDSPWGRGRNCE